MAKLPFDLGAYEALERARSGDYDLLADRIGDNKATAEERALARELLKRARKPNHRLPSPDKYDRYIAIHDAVSDKLNEQAALKKKGEKLSLKAAVKDAAKDFDLKKSMVYKIYADVEAAFSE